MRIDYSPFFRSTVGFDRLIGLLESASEQGYPPYNIERTDEDNYRVTLAVAGFRPDDIDITQQQNLLIIQGRKREEQHAGEMLHVGIANRGFERRFELADYVRVEHADLSDGLLTIDLVREIPDAMKPKKISLAGQRKLEVVDKGDKQADAA